MGEERGEGREESETQRGSWMRGWGEGRGERGSGDSEAVML